MKPRENRAAALPAPPEELLVFCDPSRYPRGGPGIDAYDGDREAWLAARHSWETRHGMTIAQWAGATHAELASRAGTLAELNEAFALTMYEADDDWEDPRLTAAAAGGRA